MMDVDLFMELSTSPHAKRGAVDACEDGLSLVRASDAAGFDAVWLAEHHFLGEYCSSAAPEMILAAMARETQRIKLGFGIIPLPIHDIVRVAERLATLDMISQGRVMWGVGRGVAMKELKGFGIDPATSRDEFLTRFKDLQEILKTGTVTRGDQSYTLQPPPSPRLGTGWLAAVSPESFDLAAELKMNVMSGPFKPWPMVKADLARYRRLRPEGETSFTLAVYCEEDHEAARQRAAAGIIWVYEKILEFSRPIMSQRIEGYEHYRNLGWIAGLFNKVLSLSVLETLGLAVVGNPDHIRKKLQALQNSGLDRVSLVIGGGDLTAQETKRCVELLASDVLPALETAPEISTEAVPA
jgi:alkanesulfonate monooxygenase SsuD/methylene tetrahydromethanopterin reductase-like flavin-dependent oxidoreductase (luciferase family)